MKNSCLRQRLLLSRASPSSIPSEFYLTILKFDTNILFKNSAIMFKSYRLMTTLRCNLWVMYKWDDDDTFWWWKQLTTRSVIKIEVKTTILVLQAIMWLISYRLRHKKYRQNKLVRMLPLYWSCWCIVKFIVSSSI